MDPPVPPDVVEWLTTIPAGNYTPEQLITSYQSVPGRLGLNSIALGRVLRRLGYTNRRTSQGRLWEITAQAKSADLGAVGQAN